MSNSNIIKKFKKSEGMVATIALLGVSVVALAVISTATVLAIGELKMSQDGGSLDKTFYAAEAGLNEALYRLINDPGVGSHTFIIDNIRSFSLSIFKAFNLFATIHFHINSISKFIYIF